MTDPSAWCTDDRAFTTDILASWEGLLSFGLPGRFVLPRVFLKVRLDDTCYGCTAGGGSSCGGALDG